MPDNSSVHVEAIAVLEEMRAALLRYQSEVHDALTKAQREIITALDGLHERLHYWQRQLRVRQEALGQARDALAKCLSLSGPNGERADCSAPAAAVKQAERRVQEAQEAIHTAQIHIKRVEEANAGFQRQAHRFNTMLTSNELPKASALLSKCVSILQSYISQQTPSVGQPVSSILKTAFKGIAGLSISAIMAMTPAASPSDFTKIPIPLEPSATSASSERTNLIRQGAEIEQEMVDVAYRIEEKKKEIQDDIEKRLQQGQHGASPPE